MKPINECKTVAELLEDPARWRKDALASTAGGVEVPPRASNAACFCLLGAVDRIYGEDTALKIEAKEKLISTLQCDGSLEVERWNDLKDRTHAEVLEAVRKAGI